MRRFSNVMVGALLAAGAVAGLPPIQAAPFDVLFEVADGPNLFDANGDCVGDSNSPTGAVALHHWHVGIPIVEDEATAGFGCLGGPRSWTVTISAGHGAFQGSVLYINDDNEPGAALNDVHINVYDSTDTLLTSTLLSDRPRPVVPGVTGPQSHDINFFLEPGTYRVVEDVFSGVHTAWVTNFKVIEAPGHG